MFLGSIGRDFEFYYDPKDFYKNLPNYGQNFKVPMSNPWRLQTNIVFHSGRLLRSDSKYLNNERGELSLSKTQMRSSKPIDQ